MSEELEQVEEHESDVEQVEEHESDVEQESDEVTAPEAVEGGPERFNQQINKKHRELMEERRAREALEARLQEIEAKQAPQSRPEIPPLPDPYDEDFDAQMKARDAKILEAAKYDARQETLYQQQQQQREQQQRQKQTELETLANSYAQRAAKLNITGDMLKAAGETVAAVGISDQLAEHILQDEQGPLITTYLARNPGEIEALQNLTPFKAALYLEQKIKTRLSGGRKQADIPAPADTLRGGGTTRKERGPAGATYE
jgi:hypothetical protein